MCNEEDGFIHSAFDLHHSFEAVHAEWILQRKEWYHCLVSVIQSLSVFQCELCVPFLSHQMRR